MILTLWISHGFTVRASVAMLGTLAALVLTGVLGSVPTEVGRFSGLADDASQYIAALNSDVDVGACSWQAPVIGALGCARRRHRHPDCGGVGAGAGRP